MSDVITNNLDIWTTALLSKSSIGRGNDGKREAYGIKKLRELILELAVRGSLVPQDPSDEPAFELLTRTIAERKQLIKEGRMREAKPPMFPVESPNYELPSGWVWTSLYEVGEIAPRNEADDAAEASFVPMQAISEDYGVPVQHEVRLWGEIKSGFTHFREDDVVLAKITPCFQNGKSAVMHGLTNGFGAGTTELHVYRPIGASTVPKYVLIYLKSPRFIGDGIPRMTGTAGQKRITRDYFAGNRFPLPPLAEQGRIVAKVDELMAFCEQLEQQQTHSIEAHQTLVESLLGLLTSAASPQELMEVCTKFASNVDTLFTTEESVDRFKQAVLQLAFTGKLVPQDPHDEPASALLESIAREKKRLVEEGSTNAQKPLPEIGDDEGPHSLPESWAWTRLGNIAQHNSGKTLDRGRNTGQLRDYITTSNLYWGRFDLGDIRQMLIRDDELEKCTARRGDLLICEGGEAGRAAVWHYDKDICFQNHIHRARFHGAIDPYFVYRFFEKLSATGEIDKHRKGVGISNMSSKALASIVVPLPPLAEQRRIVAKVDELMALCDGLKTGIADAQATQVQLADAIVEKTVAYSGRSS